MRHSAILFGTTLLFGLPGCVVSSNDQAPARSSISEGSLTLDWTINGSTDPSQCNQSVVTNIDILVTTPNGTPVGEFQQPCTDGVATISLSSGAYAAETVLLDRAGTERTTWIDIAPFTIYSNTDLAVSVDFPANSFN